MEPNKSLNSSKPTLTSEDPQPKRSNDRYEEKKLDETLGEELHSILTNEESVFEAFESEDEDNGTKEGKLHYNYDDSDEEEEE